MELIRHGGATAAAVLASPRAAEGAGRQEGARGGVGFGPRCRARRPGRGLPPRLPAGRRRGGPGAGLARPGRGRRPGGVPLLRSLVGAGRRGPRLALRRRRPHRAEPAPLGAPARVAGGDASPRRTTPSSSDVAEAVVTLEERSRVRAALARLPRKQAVALVLRHSGLSYAEVAAALDLSPGSVGTTVRRAESALRKELNRHASSD